MRVALVCPYAWDRPGGVQTHIRSLSRALRDRDHEVLVLAPTIHRHEEPEPGTLFAGVAVPIPANGSVAPISFGPSASAGVRRSLTAFDPDVVHLHEPLIPSLSLLALWSAGSRPCVGTFHASAETSAGYWIARSVLDRAARRLTVRTAVSDAARALVSRYFPGEYLITPNGVDVDRFAQAEPLDSLPAGKKVLFFGRIERRKGLEVLIQAMTRLRELDVTLIVGGTGPEERSAKRLAEQLQVRTQFLGEIQEKDVARLYRSVDVYVAPGLGGESFGIVLLEAMAAGAPVVCSSLPGFREVAGQAAALVPADQPGPLADAIRDVLRGWGEELARKGKARAGSFDWSRLAVGVEALYQKASSEALSA